MPWEKANDNHAKIMMMKIKNFDEIALTDARRALLAIAEAGYETIDTEAVLAKAMRLEGDMLTLADQKIDLGAVGKIVFVAIGKCSAEAGAYAERILGDRIATGVVVDVKVCPELGRIRTFCGTHPLPSTENLQAATAIVDVLNGLTEKDLVICVISGGGSTLLFLPEDKASREEVPIMTALIDAGATIQEINIVRKHLSYARGGNLAKDAYPARVVSLIFSDVVGNDVSSIASGPTVKDTTTIADAEAILAKFNVLQTCHISACGLIETPKEDKYFEHVSNLLVVSNRHALEGMKTAAERIGFSVDIRGSELTGNADDVGEMIASAVHAAPAHSVLLWAGETTVTVRNPDGRGGRNLQLCASALRFIHPGEEILSLASDGRDHGAFAGAICDTMTKTAAAAVGMDPEKFRMANDTYPFFEKVGNYLMTGDTGSNVSDLIIGLKE
jgi:glycerate-2-kinase